MNENSRTINAGKNTISAIVNRLLLLILTFISRRLFIDYIGVDYLGINGLFANILTLLSMADLGLGTAMNISLYKPIALNDKDKIAALLYYYKKLYRYIALGVLLLGTLLTPFLKYIVNIDQDIPYLYLIYYLFVFKNVASYLFIYKSAIVRADQKQYVINHIEMLINVARVFIQIVLIITTRNYLIYILVDVIAVIVQNIVISFKADKLYPFISNHSDLTQNEKKSIFSDMSSITLYKVSWSLLNGTDSIIMSILVGTIYVGYYSNYLTITTNVETFIALVFTSLTASVGNLIATANYEKRYKTFRSMQLISFWLCAIATVSLYYLTQDFIEIWIGKEMQLDQLTLVAIVVNVFFSTCMRPVWTFREGTGMYKQIRYIMFVTAVLNIILSIVLGTLLGIAGILFATVISKICTYFWYEPKKLFEGYFNVSVLKYYFDYLKTFVLIFISGTICHFVFIFLPQVNIGVWIIKAIICIVIVSLAYYLAYFRTEEFQNIKNKVKTLINDK